MELSNFGLSDLQALEHKVRTEIKRREEGERENAWYVIQEIARNAGVPLKDLLSVDATSQVKVAPKYRHPEKTALL